MSPSKKPRPKGSAKARRTAARLAAVQALYQQEQTQAKASDVVAEFMNFRLGHEIDGDRYVSADPTLLSSIVRGTEARSADIDRIAGGCLGSAERFERLELLLRAILRAGIYELLNHADIPSALLIKEYVDITGGFYGGSEPGLVNGVLDRAARTLRDGDFSGDVDSARGKAG